MQLVKSEHEKIDKISAEENKQRKAKEELSHVKGEAETPDDSSQVVEEKQSDECVDTVSSEEKKDDAADCSKSEIST